MLHEAMAPLGTYRRTLTAVVAGTAGLQTVWMQVHAMGTPLGSAEGDVVGDTDEEEPVDALTEDVVGGELSNAITSIPADIPDTPEDPNAEALVVVPDIPTTAPVTTPGNTGEEVANAERNPVEEPAMDLDNTNGNVEKKAPVRTETTVPSTTDPLTTETLTEPLPQTTEPALAVETTTKPSLRTQDPTVISDALTNDAAGPQATGYLSQGSNPLVLVALAGICCIFLFLWGRKRRPNATLSSSTSGSGNSKGSKVQYTQVPDEQPFSHSQDDDDEYCDDYEEDTFANDRDDWDDWEGNSTQAQVSQLNPFAAPPSAPRPTTPRQSNPSPFKLTQPLSPPPQQQQQHAQLQEIAIAGKGDLLPSSVESNSSSDSFEVVTDEVHAPPTSSHAASADTEKEGESVDDLFSQFGMVPTFKKSAVVPPPPAPTSAAPVSQPVMVSSLPTAAEASALFAAEMDDELTEVDAADEWGEDDEWVKGI